MQQPTIKQLPKSQVEMKFIVTPEEAKPFLDQAVIDISTNRPLKGFRPGKATYEDIKRAYGEMTIWETALERIVRARYVKTVLDEKLETIGSPGIAVDSLVPNQDIAFTVTASVMPHTTKIADYSKPIVEQKRKEITDEAVDHAVQDLQKMRRKEVVNTEPVTAEGMALIDLEIKKDGVVVEGGVSRDYRVYLNEAHYIPGFSEQLVGLKRGDVKTFELPFPSDHYNKQLAGHTVEFVVTVKDVYELQLPELNDEFAKGLGIDSMSALRDLLKKNLQQEEDHRSLEASEIEMLEKLTKDSRFSEIPEILISEEVQRMIGELEHSVDERGMKMEDYLSSIKKTKDDLRLDFVPTAIQRIQTSTLIKDIAKQENLEVSDDEIGIEQDRILLGLKEDQKDTREMVSSPEYRDYIAGRLRNQKVLDLLRKQTIKGYQIEKE